MELRCIVPFVSLFTYFHIFLERGGLTDVIGLQLPSSMAIGGRADGRCIPATSAGPQVSHPCSEMFIVPHFPPIIWGVFSSSLSVKLTGVPEPEPYMEFKKMNIIHGKP